MSRRGHSGAGFASHFTAGRVRLSRGRVRPVWSNGAVEAGAFELRGSPRGRGSASLAVDMVVSRPPRAKAAVLGPTALRGS